MNPICTINASSPYLELAGLIEITFLDGTKQAFDQALLKKFPFFKTCFSSSFKETKGGIVFPTITKEVFNLVIGLFYDNRHILDLLDDDSLTNPDVYADLQNLIGYLFVNETAGAFATINEELSVLHYNQALSLLNNYHKTEDLSSTASKPFYLSTIERIIINNMHFENTEDHEINRLSIIRNFQKKIVKKIRQSRIIKETIKSCRVQSNNSLHKLFDHKICYPFIKNEGSIEFIDILQSILEKKKNDIAMENNCFIMNKPHINLINLKPSKIYRLSHMEAKNEISEAESYLAKRCWKIYKFQTLASLQFHHEGNYRLRMELICPKLFAYYNLIPNIEYQENIWNWHDQKSVAHYLKREGMKIYHQLENSKNLCDLENKIRNFLKLHSIDLPERIFTNENQSLKNSNEVAIDVQEVLEHLLTEPEDAKKNLIQLWKWNKFEINSKDFEIIPLSTSLRKENVLCLEGLLDKFDEKIRFIFKLDSLQPIILDYDIDPTPEAAHAHLKQLYLNRNVSSISKFNYFSNR